MNFSISNFHLPEKENKFALGGGHPPPTHYIFYSRTKSVHHDSANNLQNVLYRESEYFTVSFP